MEELPPTIVAFALVADTETVNPAAAELFPAESIPPLDELQLTKVAATRNIQALIVESPGKELEGALN
jgi:hypothetical protein